MPYIKHHERVELAIVPAAATPGELNYLITKLLSRYIADHGLSYSKINDCLGAVEGAKLEFYRRVAVPYENGAINRNGDVFPEEQTR